MKFKSEMLLLYAVTDRNLSGSNLLNHVEEALSGGVTLVQLREKSLGLEEFVDEAVKMRALCHRYGVPLIINDSVEVAKLSGADGVHVGLVDASVESIRNSLGRDFIIGATAKTVERARECEIAGADYLGVGAVFPSPTKQSAVRITKEKLKEICSSVSIPVVAIGGITAQNVGQIAGAGMDGIAVISGIFASQFIKNAVSELKELARAAVEDR